MSENVTVTLTDEQVVAIQDAVSSGEAESVAAFVAAAVAEKCAAPGEQKKQPGSLKELLAQWDEELGPPSAEAEAWAEEQIARLLGRAQSA